MSNRLHNKVIVITGASKGVGKEIATTFVKEGAKVYGLARNQAQMALLRDSLQDYSGQFIGIPCNITSQSEVKEAFQDIYTREGKIDGLINNAGVGHYAPIEELTVEQWDEMMDVNLKGLFLCSQAVIPDMKRRKDGHIINIVSVAGLTTFVKGAGYCASKHGVMAFTDVLIQELKSYGVRVSSICPGSIQTDFGGTPAKDYSLLPNDIAEIALFMLTQPDRVILNQVVVRPQIPFD